MIKRYKNTAISQYIIISVISAAVIGFGFISTILMQNIVFTDHFALPWAAGRTWLLEGINPYEESVAAAAEGAINGSGYLAVLPDERILTQPLINLFIYLPFSLIPYGISRAIWVTLSMLMTGLSVSTALKLTGWKLSIIEKVGIILLTTFWLPGSISIFTGSLVPLVFLIFLYSIMLILNEQDTTAGFLLSLTFGSLLISVFIVLFLLIWAISKKKWTVIKAYFGGVAFILVLSWLLLPSWFMDWLNIILPKLQDFGWIQTPLLMATSLLPGIERFLGIFLHGILGIFLITQIVTVVRKSGQKFIWKFFVILIIAYLFNIQPTMGYMVLLLPGAFFVFRFWVERWRVFGRLLSWGVVLLMTIGSWLLFNPEVGFVEIEASLVFIVGLPIIVLLGMTWIRWWAFRIPKFEPGI